MKFPPHAILKTATGPCSAEVREHAIRKDDIAFIAVSGILIF